MGEEPAGAGVADGPDDSERPDRRDHARRLGEHSRHGPIQRRIAERCARLPCVSCGWTGDGSAGIRPLCVGGSRRHRAAPCEGDTRDGGACTAARTFSHAGRALVFGLFGHGFSEGSTALTILVLGQVFNAGTGAVGMALVMTKHERSAIIATLGGTCLNIALCALLIPGWGPSGAASATAASIVLINVLFMIAVVKKLRIRPTIFGIRLPRIA